jgi:hypothetical protein
VSAFERARHESTGAHVLPRLLGGRTIAPSSSSTGGVFAIVERPWAPSGRILKKLDQDYLLSSRRTRRRGESNHAGAMAKNRSAALTCTKGEHDEHVEEAEPRCDEDEEVAGPGFVQVIPNEGVPALEAPTLEAGWSVLGDGARGEHPHERLVYTARPWGCAKCRRTRVGTESSLSPYWACWSRVA